MSIIEKLSAFYTSPSQGQDVDMMSNTLNIKSGFCTTGRVGFFRECRGWEVTEEPKQARFLLFIHTVGYIVEIFTFLLCEAQSVVLIPIFVWLHSPLLDPLYLEQDILVYTAESNSPSIFLTKRVEFSSPPYDRVLPKTDPL